MEQQIREQQTLLQQQQQQLADAEQRTTTMLTPRSLSSHEHHLQGIACLACETLTACCSCG